MGITYWANASVAVGRNVARDLISPSRHFNFTRGLLRSGLMFEAAPAIPSLHFLDLFPDAESLTVPMGEIRFRRSNANPFEVYCLSAITMLAQPRRIFEIGTFDGATTLRFAKAAPSAQVFTLDLPPDSATAHSTAHSSELQGEHQNVVAGVGQRYQNTPEAPRIHQLLGDSRTFDYSPYHQTCDLVFVDACHEYEFVKSDTQSALRLLQPKGILLWHDYVPGWPGVVRAVDELLPNSGLVHIAGTSLAMLNPKVDRP